MQDVNSITLVCRLVKDPELRSTGGGTEVCSLRVAYTQNRKEGSQWVESAGFIDVTVFGKQAETVTKYLTKGRQIVVQGRLDFREWGEGSERQSRTQIIANQVQFIGAGEGSGSSQSSAPQSAPLPVRDDDDTPF